MDNHSSWSVQVTACLSVDGIEVFLCLFSISDNVQIPVNQVKTVGPYELECKIASEGYPYLKTVVGKKADCMGGHPHGSEWIEKSFRFRCDKRGKSRFVGCIAGDGSLLLDGETKTVIWIPLARTRTICSDWRTRNPVQKTRQRNCDHGFIQEIIGSLPETRRILPRFHGKYS